MEDSQSGAHFNGGLASSWIYFVSLTVRRQMTTMAAVDVHLPNLFWHSNVGDNYRYGLVVYWTYSLNENIHLKE